jgi:hypothetical protein
MNLHKLVITAGLVCVCALLTIACNFETVPVLPEVLPSGGEPVSPAELLQQTALLSANSSRIIRGDDKEGSATLTVETSTSASVQWFACVLETVRGGEVCSDRPVTDLLKTNYPFRLTEVEDTYGVYVADGADSGTSDSLEIEEVIGDPGAGGTTVLIVAVSTFLSTEENPTPTPPIVVSDIKLLLVRPAGALTVSVSSDSGASIEPGETIVLSAVVGGGSPFAEAVISRSCPADPTELDDVPPCDVYGESTPPNNGEAYAVAWEVRGLAGGTLSVPCLCSQDDEVVSTALYTAPLATGNVTFRVEATDAKGISEPATLSVTVAPKNDLAFSLGASGTVLAPGQTVELSATASGGLAPYTILFETTSQTPRIGSLSSAAPDPDDLPSACGDDQGRSEVTRNCAGICDASAAYTACPNRTGSDVVTATLTDALGTGVVRTIPLTIASPLTLSVDLTSTVNGAQPNTQVPIRATILGGTPPYTVCYLVDSGSIDGGAANCTPVVIGEEEYDNCECDLGDQTSLGEEAVFDDRTFTTPGVQDIVPIRVAVRDAVGVRATSALTLDVSSYEPGPTPGPGPVNLSVTVADDTLCPGGTTTLSASASGGTGSNSYLYELTGGPAAPGESLTPPGWTSATTAAYAAPSAGGTARNIKVTVQETGGSTDFANVVITTFERPAADAGGDREVCANDADFAVGGAPSASGANPPFTYAWTGSGAIFLSAVTAANPLFDVASAGPGVYQLCLQVTSGVGCTSAADCLDVVVYDVPAATAAASPNPVCEGGDVQLTGGPGGLVSYAWAGPDGYASTDQSPLVPAALGGDYTLTVTNADGCVDTETVIVVLDPAPAVTTHPLSTCPEGAVLGLALVAPYITASDYESVLWTGGDGTFDPDRQTLNATYTPTQDEIDNNGVILTLTAQALDTSVCTAPASAQLEIAISDNPEAVIFADDSVCEGTTGHQAEVAITGATYDWTITNGNIIGPADVRVIEYEPTGLDPITLNVTVDQPGQCHYLGEKQILVDLNPAPTITADPGAEVCGGTTVTLDAGAGYAGYVWEPGGETSRTIVATASGTYSVTVTDANGCVGVDDITLTVYPSPTPGIVASPAAEVCEGTTVTLDAGAGYAGYVWAPGGETSQTIDVTTTDEYCVTVTDGNGCEGSACLQVDVHPDPVPGILAIPGTQVCEGATVTLVADSGYAGYVWAPGGETTRTIVVPTDTVGTFAYTVTVTDAFGCQGSGDIDVTVDPTLSVEITVTDPAAPPYCDNYPVTLDAGAGFSHYEWSTGASGDEAAARTIQVDSSGIYSVTVTQGGSFCEGFDDIDITLEEAPPAAITAASSVCPDSTNGASVPNTPGADYLWDVIGDGSIVDGQGTRSIIYSVGTVSPVTITVQVTDNGCTETDSVDVNIRPSVEITRDPADLTVCEGVLVTLDAGPGFVDYEWSDGTSGDEAAARTIVVTAVFGDNTRTVTVEDAAGCVTSDDISFWADIAPSITDQPNSAEVCEGDPVMFSVTAAGGTTSAPLSYQWQYSPDGVAPYTDIGGATGDSYTIDPVAPADAGFYQVVVDNKCGSETSAAAELTVDVAPTITDDPDSAEVCEGESVSFTVTAGGGTATAPLSYVWQKFNGVWEDVPGAPDADTYTIDPVAPADAGDYRVVVSNKCGSENSATATLTVDVAPTITDQPDSAEVCEGDPVSFTVTVGGGTATAPLSYVWQKFNGAWEDIPGAPDSDIYTIDPVAPADAGDYRVIVDNGCDPAAISDVATLTVDVAPTITDQPDSAVVSEGAPVTFTVAADGGTATAPLTYVWQKFNTVWEDIPGAPDADTYTIDPVTVADAGDYRVIVDNGCAPAAISDTATLTVNP